MTIRKAFFWVHLTVGLAAGSVIALMCITGAALAFEDQIVAWAERDARQISPAAPAAKPISLEDLLAAVARARPDAKPGSITLNRDPNATVVVSIGRGESVYVSPYDGGIRYPTSHAARDLMRRLRDWHRMLGRTGESLPAGKAITGACNVAFLFLTLSGAVLWWPRKWRTKGLRRSLWFLRDATGRAREWNWHNVTGFWLLPVLIVLTASGAVLSYRGLSDWITHFAGDSPRREPPRIAAPTPDSHPLGPTSLMAAAQREFPQAQSFTLYLAEPEAGHGAWPAWVSVKSAGAWPRTATTALTLDPFTGRVLNREQFRDLPAGRRIRTWLRFLHTGEALGPVGQFVAGLGCLGGCLLVYTGFALAWRRFRGEKKSPPTPEPNGVG